MNQFCEKRELRKKQTRESQSALNLISVLIQVNLCLSINRVHSVYYTKNNVCCFQLALNKHSLKFHSYLNSHVNLFFFTNTFWQGSSDNICSYDWLWKKSKQTSKNTFCCEPKLSVDWLQAMDASSSFQQAYTRLLCKLAGSRVS